VSGASCHDGVLAGPEDPVRNILHDSISASWHGADYSWQGCPLQLCGRFFWAVTRKFLMQGFSSHETRRTPRPEAPHELKSRAFKGAPWRVTPRREFSLADDAAELDERVNAGEGV